MRYAETSRLGRTQRTYNLKYFSLIFTCLNMEFKCGHGNLSSVFVSTEGRHFVYTSSVFVYSSYKRFRIAYQTTFLLFTPGLKSLRSVNRVWGCVNEKENKAYSFKTVMYGRFSLVYKVSKCCTPTLPILDSILNAGLYYRVYNGTAHAAIWLPSQEMNDELWMWRYDTQWTLPWAVWTTTRLATVVGWQGIRRQHLRVNVQIIHKNFMHPHLVEPFRNCV